MPFGLRNARATYQHLVDKAFHKQIGRNLEVYVDDLVIKSHTEEEIIRDIEETFKNLRDINMKLNPKKCTFGVEEWIFLGYKVNTKGMKVCPDKVDAVLSLLSLKCLKDVHKLNEKLASLNRFLAKSAEKSLPFFKTLKKCMKKSDFCWTDKAESMFKKMKQHIAELLMLMALEEKEELIVYLAATRETILADFIVERPEEDSIDTPMKIEEKQSEPWILFTDGSSYADGSGAGLILTSSEGIEFTYALIFGFEATNNEAEYEALIAVNGTYIAKEADMIRYMEKIKTLTNGFRMFTIKQIPRSKNKKADALSKIASTSFAHLSKQVLVKELKEKSTNEAEILVIVKEEGETRMTPIHDYNTGGILPAEVDRARVVKRKSQWPFPEGPGKRFASVKHPQTNSLVERANRSLGEGIKARLEARSKNWMEEISHVLWAHRTMIKSSNGDTHFSLTYGMEAVILAEIGMPTLRTAEIDVVRNDEALEVNLDLLEERREQSAICEAKSKRKMKKY
ncbi:reverse transcriptase domain-containing protein [Tanacetum coccineum]